MIYFNGMIGSKSKRKIINSKDVLKFSEIELLGTIPNIVNEEEKSVTNQRCFDKIINKLLFNNAYNENKTILIENCNRLEENNWVPFHLALSLNKFNKKVLFIVPEAKNNNGKEDIDLKVIQHKIKKITEINIDVLTNVDLIAYLSKKSELKKLERVFIELKNKYDYIIIDTPSKIKDSGALSSIIDSTVLIVNSKISKKRDLINIKKNIQENGGNIIGVILNKQKVADYLEDNEYDSNYKEKNEGNEQNKTVILDLKKETKNIIEENKMKNELYRAIDQKYEDIKIELDNTKNNIISEIQDTMKNNQEDNKLEIESICNGIKEHLEEIVEKSNKNNNSEIENAKKEISLEFEDKLINIIDENNKVIERKFEEKIDTIKEQLSIEFNNLINQKNKNNIEEIELIKNELDEKIDEKEDLQFEKIELIKCQLNEELKQKEENQLGEIEVIRKQIREEFISKHNSSLKEIKKVEKKLLEKINNLKEVEDTYSIYENIKYEDLEKISMYIIPIKKH
ncbi:MAG: hypothetical protein IKG14_06360 [Clostridia bacterium]|nr:hypothetical protein [Clostridia bacterium]